jgi:hypothetical protein
MAVANNLMNMRDQMVGRYQNLPTVQKKALQGGANKYFGGGQNEGDDEEFNPINAIGDAVKKLNSVNDEANSWQYANEKEKAETREDLRKMASEAYEAATPEQRTQNKDFITAAALSLNPPATPSSIAASDPTSQLDSQPTSQPTPQTSSIDSQQAARNVMLARQSGSGLAAYDAMQDPNYVLGSGSSLRQRRRIGTQSGDMRREARRLRKQGYTKAAERMALGAAEQKLGEGSAIRTQGDITSQMQDQSRMRNQLGQIEGLNQRMIEYQNRLLDRRMRQLDEDDEDDGPSYTLLNE